MHHIFIVNPTAGKGKAAQMVERIDSFFKTFGEPHEISMTKAPGHAQIIAKEAISLHKEIRLYSVGGDGTLNEVVNGIADSFTELGIIPCGTGNDSVKSIYSVTDPVKLIELLPSSSSTLMDAGKVNEKFFINIASLGFDADVAKKGQAFKKIPFVSGSLAYILGVLSALIQLNKYKVKFSIESSSSFLKHNKELLMAVFANGSYYGGGMKPAPRAKTDDGLLDFYLVDPVNHFKLLKFFPAFKKGQHETMKEVNFARGEKAVFESERFFPVNIDGEVTLEKRIEIKLLPKALRVIRP